MSAVREHVANGETFEHPVVSIVLPCLNEVRTLRAVFEKCLQALDSLGVPGEIIVADNGSTDGSQELARSLGARVVTVAVRGYGAALYQGCRAARGKYLIIGDADDSYDFREAVPMVRKLQTGYDFCMGTRIRGHIEPGAMPWKNRHIGTPILTAALNTIFASRFSDVNCGLRALTKDAFSRMRLESQGMEFASEMLIKASLLGLRTTELPITLHKDGRDREPHLRPWHDGWRHLKFMLLFAPKFIYWVPGVTMLVIGIAGASLLLSRPGGVPYYIGKVPINDHWIVPAALLMVVGYQTIVTGVLVHLYTVIHRVYHRSVFAEKLMNALTMERILFLAAILMLVGGILEASVVDAWVSGNFGPLNAIRPAVLGMGLIVMGTQTMFSGFFYAVLIERYEKGIPTFE